MKPNPKVADWLAGFGERLAEAMNDAEHEVRDGPNKTRAHTGGQQACAEAVGVSKSTISALLDHGIKPKTSARIVVLLAEHLNVSVGWLLAGELPKKVEDLNPAGTRYRISPDVVVTSHKPTERGRGARPASRTKADRKR